jgi:hypothetical protein
MSQKYMQGLLLSMKEITLLCGMRDLLRGRMARGETNLRATAAVQAAAPAAALAAVLQTLPHQDQMLKTHAKANPIFLIEDLMLEMKRREVAAGKGKTRTRSSSKPGGLTSCDDIV